MPARTGLYELRAMGNRPDDLIEAGNKIGMALNQHFRVRSFHQRPLLTIWRWREATQERLVLAVRGVQDPGELASQVARAVGARASEVEDGPPLEACTAFCRAKRGAWHGARSGHHRLGEVGDWLSTHALGPGDVVGIGVSPFANKEWAEVSSWIGSLCPGEDLKTTHPLMSSAAASRVVLLAASSEPARAANLANGLASAIPTVSFHTSDAPVGETVPLAVSALVALGGIAAGILLSPLAYAIAALGVLAGVVIGTGRWKPVTTRWRNALAGHTIPVPPVRSTLGGSPTVERNG